MKSVTAFEGFKSSEDSLKWIGAVMAENSVSMVIQINGLWSAGTMNYDRLLTVTA